MGTMPEENGSGVNVRLDRIERILEQTVLTLDHVAGKLDYIASETKMLLQAQVILQGQVEEDRKQSIERDKKLDERIAALVSAIGALVARDAKPGL
jgi:hypothetical protein